MTASTAAGLLAGLIAALLFGVAAVVQARAVRRQGGRPDRAGAFWRAVPTEPLILLVILAYLIGFVLHAVAIWLLPLYLAQASIALSFPITAWLSRTMDHTSGLRRALGAGAITVGLVLLATTAGVAGESVVGWRFASVLVVGVVALVLAGRAGSRAPGHVIGALAGLGYAGSAIAVRGVTIELTGPVVVAALCVPAYGAVAFWLYSLAMHSDDVAPATGALIVLQTLVPALAGVWALGDTLPAGGALVAAIGVVLAMGGVQALSVSSGRVPGNHS